ncbi:M1 family metallopeptidase [Streptomyces sp. NPDC047315]|uniref:M1 family metallopeptidase n=1 Tax=Streptomyces sp. NPDC047315 TaxID=3155142 RepID=UPI0033E5B4A5
MRRLPRFLVPLVPLALLVGCTDGGVSGGVSGTPGAAGLRDPLFPRLGNGGYDVRHYRLTLEYDPSADRLSGSAEILADATQDLSAFNLDLHGMEVADVTVDGAPAAANRAGDELTVRPRDELRRGAPFRTVVRYAGTPRTITDRDGAEEGWLRTAAGGVLALGQPAGSMAWFPGNHHPSDKATYDVAVTVPRDLAALSNGELVRETTKGAARTSVWRSTAPMASYLATLVIGPYGTTNGRTRDGLPVLSAADPTVAARTAAVAGRVAEVTEWAAGRFGPYPFSSVGAIAVRDGAAGYALETQNRPVIPAGMFDLRTLVHELAHQWYGNSVTPANWRDMWLSEGFATYAEWLWAEDREGTPADDSFAEAYETDANWAFPPAAPPSAEHVSDAPVYGRGAMVLHQVRREVGEEKFLALLKGWPERHRHGNASTRDFTSYAEEVSGRDLGKVWKVWLYGTGGRPR